MKLGCSSLSWQTQDGKHVLGRTCDMFVLPNSGPMYLPRNYQLSLSSSGDVLSTRYSYVGFSMMVTDTPIFIDGINEHGLMGCLLYYPGFARYGSRVEGKLNMNPIYFLTYVLGSFTNIEELVSNLNQINLVDDGVAGGEAPVHYIVSDASGETVIIEPDAGGLSVHRQTIGVMTNSPNYDWHRQNLRNYIGMQTASRRAQDINGFTVQPFGEGTGLLGLPGDYTPTSRFVRVAYIKSLLDQPRDEINAVAVMHNLLASVTIPMGLHRNNAGEAEGTLYTSMMCSESLTYYISTMDNHRVSAIRLGDIKDGPDVRRYGTSTAEDINWLS